MEENFKERLENIEELDRMLDTVFQNNSTGKEKAVDIIKHNDISFTITENGQELTVIKDIYEVIVTENGRIMHEIYDDQGKLLMPPIPDESFHNLQSLLRTGNMEVDNNLLESVMEDERSMSLIRLENENKQQVADVLGMNVNDVKAMQTTSLQTSNSLDVNNFNSNPALKAEIDALKNMGYSIDTTELATDEDTIKEFLGTDADELLVVKINSDWKIFKVNDDGSLAVEDNLEISANESAFHTVNDNGKRESRIAEIEFRRKDHPDHSLAIDYHNNENTTQIYLIAGNSRTATEIESKTLQQPYVDQINNEKLKKAQENPDDINLDLPPDPHEPILEPNANNH